MKNKHIIIRQRIKKLNLFCFFFCFFVSSVQSQSYLPDNVKTRLKETGLEFIRPDNFYSIDPPGNYPPIHPDFEKSPFLIGLVNYNNNKIMITISMMPYPKPINKISRYLIANVDLNHISEKALALEIDTNFSKLKFIKASYIKKINADRGYIYNIKVQDKYLGIYPRCKKIVVYKDNIGRAEILFFYKENQEKIINEEVVKTWGMLKFK
jgi:hypothetical protein